jgi:Flavin-binding monooxygenase-like
MLLSGDGQPWQWQVTTRPSSSSRISDPNNRPSHMDSAPHGKASDSPAAQQRSPLQTEVFDAVVVCNGHYTEPNVPSVSGMESFPGLQMHAHNYRSPEQFAGQVCAR